jgi:hypothetical protein
MKHRVAFLTIFLLGTLGARAGLITSAPAGSTTTVFAPGSSCAQGVDAGFTVTGTGCWPASTVYLFGTNGAWDNPPAGFSYIALNNATGSFTIALGGLYSAVGGFINYSLPISAGGPPSSVHPDITPGASDPVITALAADGVTVLDIYDISIADPINTPGGVNTGAFVGIQDPTNDIAFLEFSNDYIAIHSITVDSIAGVTAAPEPAAVLLLGSGMVLLLIRRKALSNR